MPLFFCFDLSPLGNLIMKFPDLQSIEKEEKERKEKEKENKWDEHDAHIAAYSAADDPWMQLLLM